MVSTGLAGLESALSIERRSDGLACRLDYDSEALPAAYAEELSLAFRTLLESSAADPSVAVGKLQLLNASSSKCLLVEWNATEAPYPVDRCIHELIEEQVVKTPDNVAVVYEDAQLTYTGLNARANRLAHYLRELGVGPESRVALCLERSVDMVVSLLAVLKAGGAYVPLDPSYPLERLQYMLDDSAPAIVVTNGSIADSVRELLECASARVLDFDADAALWYGAATSNPDRGGLTAEHLAYIIYTSGSTGRPKGVMVEHRGICNLSTVQARTLEIDAESHVLQFASFSFDASVFESILALCNGATLYFPPTDAMVGDSLAMTFNDGQITHALLPPVVLSSIAEELDFERARVLIVGGDASNSKLVKRWARGRRLVNAYGPTESTVVATLYECDSDREGPVPIGRPIANARIYILNEHREPVPIGVAGELYIGGVGVARGYWNRPELTAQRFIASPFVDGDRLYKTGDVARYLPDGNIEFLGRNDFQVKIRGFRIELGEIESCLARYAGIRDAVVVAREDDSDKRLMAYYVAEEGAATIEAEQLRAHLQSALPEYMVPVAYVELASLPVTANGKVDRKALPAPDDSAYARRAYEAPQGEVESALAQVWSEVLGVQRVGRHDDFFELGGHSVLVVRMLSRVREALGSELALSALFAQPILKDVAALLEAGSGKPLPPIDRVERDGALPLSYAQQRMWFLAQTEGVSEAYHILQSLHLQGTLDRVALKRALDRLIVRHEPLRTTFAVVDGTPVQCIGDAQRGFVLVEHDLRGHVDAREQLEALSVQEPAAAFDLETGPLVRGRLIQLDRNDHVLMLTMHHIVSDGWSMGVFARELGALYESYRAGGDDPLEPLGVQYADYAMWQRRWLSGEVLEAQSAYWSEQLHGAPALLELPTDYRRPAQQDHAGDHVVVEFDAELTAQLKSLSQRHGTTLFMTLLAGWGALLSRLSGQDDVVIGTPVANRRHTEVENLVGLFTNTLALHLDYSGGQTVAQILERVKHQSVQAQEFQDMPFERVVELVNPPRSLSHEPVFQVMFAWQNNAQIALELGGLTVTPLAVRYPIAKFDLSLELMEEDGCIRGSLRYATSIFERETVQRYVEHLRRLFAGMVVADEEPIARLAVMSPAERHQILVEWNATERQNRADVCVHELFEEQVERTPNAAAVVHEQTQLSYAEVNRRANRLAHRLRALGVGPDARVALCLERSVEMVVSMLAVLKAGGAYVPLDPSHPLERLAYMVEDSAPSVVLTHGLVARSVQAVLDRAGAPIIAVDRSELWSDASAENPARGELTPAHLAYMIYTSGSTGRPKGVMVQHRNVARLFESTQGWFKFGAGDVWALFHSCAFDFSVWEMWGALLHGGRLVIVPQIVSRSPQEFYKLVCEHGVTILNQTPSAFRELIAAQGMSLDSHRLRHVIFGGEALDVITLKPWYDRGSNGATCLTNMYGITETTVHVTHYELTPKDCERRGAGSPIGRPIPDLRVYIVDEQLAPVPIGVAGELYIGGAGVARGYWNRPELTAERFIPSPFVEGDRLYKTGDVARYMPDGNIEFLGRNDFQVKIRGFRVELGEIESGLAMYTGIRDAVVIAGKMCRARNSWWRTMFPRKVWRLRSSSCGRICKARSRSTWFLRRMLRSRHCR